MARSSSSFQIILLAALCIALTATAFVGKPDSLSVINLIAGLLAIAINSVTVLLIRRKYATKTEDIILSPILYTVLALTVPFTHGFHFQLIPSILLNVSILLNINFSERPDKPALFVLSMFALEAAAIFWIPVLWMAIPYTVMGIVRAENKIKFFVGSMLTILIPVAAYLSIMYLEDRLDTAVALIRSTLDTGLLSLPANRIINFSMLSLIKCFIVSTAMAISISRFIIRRKYNISSYLAVRVQLLVLLPALVAICILFYEKTETSTAMMICPYAAIFVNDYLSGNRTMKESRIYLILLSIIIICEKITV